MGSSIRILLLTFFGSFSAITYGQNIDETGTSSTTNVSGKVIDETSGQPVEYATVALLSGSENTAIDGTTTDVNGEFSLEVDGEFNTIEISFIGYRTNSIVEFKANDNRIDLGQIILSSDATMMEDVVIRAEKSTTEFRLDKRIFNVGKDLSSTGASALEVLNNVPSVNVDIEGGVTLRGSGGVQILIDGKPSVLAEEGGALGTITADMIETIEVVTNPSAKYDAEGTSGIINIVLKKNEQRGLNGSFSINTGIPHNHSVGISVNNRTSNFNLFSQAGVGYKELPRNGETTNTDKINGQTVKSIGEEYRNETFYNFILGTDYFINPKNVITLSGSVMYEVEDQPSSYTFSRIDENDNLLMKWERNEVTGATNPKIQYELKYKREFEDNKEHILLFSAIGNYFGKDQSSQFVNTLTSGSETLNDQQTRTKFEEGKYTFNLDYVKPFKEAWTLEAGAQYVTNQVNNDFEVKNEISGEYVVDTGLTNVFNYDQKVLGLYSTLAYEKDKWGFKGGLRVENTDLYTLLENTGEENNRNFTDFFPSAHVSYNIADNISLQAGYSRRIYRPRLWDLNPFFNIRNSFSVRAGNPNLLPEFTDSYELGSIFIYNDVTFNINAYRRYTTDKIERVSTFEDNVNIYQPYNIGTNTTTGLEGNFKYTITKSITLTGDLNYNLYTREGSFNDQVFDFTSDQWSTKLVGRYKVNKALEFEATGRYNSKEQTVQGEMSDNLYADFGARYKLNNGRAVFSLSVRDIFASRARESIVDQDDFYIYTYGQRGRFITLGFSYGFGKGEAMEFSGGRRR